MIDGIVVIDKPAGMTSHDVVNRARRLFKTKRVGHTGTLDPDATGVLVLCLGQATRLAEYLSASRKHYVAEVLFGVETDTQDASGQVTAERDASHLTEANLRALLPRFQGTIEQIPPMVSALHHQGKRLYELAREGITVERAPRQIQIDALVMTAFVPGEHPLATLEITCSTGTYIRTLSADLGEAAGVGGMMQSLRRTWVGEAENAFTLEVAQTLEGLQEHADKGTLAEVVLPLAIAVRAWPQAHLTIEQVAHIRQGQTVAVSEVAPTERVNWHLACAETPLALFDSTHAVCAIARLVADRLQPVKVLAHDETV